jgi:hypothetical protein
MLTSLSSHSPQRRFATSHVHLSNAKGPKSHGVASIMPAELQQMPFPLYARLVADLLESLGYEEVSFMKPMHLRGKGRNAHGGYDIRAFMPSRLSGSMVIAQLKQYRRPLPRLGVDELRGTMVRVGARHGLLITTGTVSPSAREALQAGQYAAPVRLIDGTELSSLLDEQRTAFPLNPLPSPTGSLPPRMPVKPFTAAGCDGSALEIRIDVTLSPVKPACSRW